MFHVQPHSASSVDILFPFGEDVGDSVLPRGNDGEANVQLSTFFPYFDSAESDLYVSKTIIQLLLKHFVRFTA